MHNIISKIAEGIKKGNFKKRQHSPNVESAIKIKLRQVPIEY
jgi:hypothetical protein